VLRCGEETKGLALHHARIEDCLDFLRLSVTQLNLYVARSEIEMQAVRRRAETLLAILQEIADLARPKSSPASSPPWSAASRSSPSSRRRPARSRACSDSGRRTVTGARGRGGQGTRRAAHLSPGRDVRVDPLRPSGAKLSRATGPLLSAPQPDARRSATAIARPG